MLADISSTAIGQHSKNGKTRPQTETNQQMLWDYLWHVVDQKVLIQVFYLLQVQSGQGIIGKMDATLHSKNSKINMVNP